MDFYIPRLAFHLASRKRNEEKALSAQEKQLRKILSKTNKQTGFGAYVHVALTKRGNADFRALLSELKDQLRDAPGGLKKILGEEGFCLLEQI